MAKEFIITEEQISKMLDSSMSADSMITEITFKEGWENFKQSFTAPLTAKRGGYFGTWTPEDAAAEAAAIEDDFEKSLETKGFIGRFLMRRAINAAKKSRAKNPRTTAFTDKVNAPMNAWKRAKRDEKAALKRAEEEGIAPEVKAAETAKAAEEAVIEAVIEQATDAEIAEAEAAAKKALEERASEGTSEKEPEGEEEREGEEKAETDSESGNEKMLKIRDDWGDKVEIEDYKWADPFATGGVSVLDGFKYKGALPDEAKEAGTTANTASIYEMVMIKNLYNWVDKPPAGKNLIELIKAKKQYFRAIAREWDAKSSLGRITDALGKINSDDEEESKQASEQVKEAFEKLHGEMVEIEERLNSGNWEQRALFNTYVEGAIKEMKEEIKDQLKKGTLNEGKLHSIVIDFAEIRRKQKHLDESFLVMFGAWVKWLLEKMFGGGSIPGTIKGSRSEVESFARAMGSEKRYIETAKRYGLDHPTTYKSKAKLSSATKGFEKETGIKWPFE